MSKGKEYLKEIHAALRDFEAAVVEREKFKLMESKVTRQQDVDAAREKVVDAVVKIVTGERMKQQ
jgi:hypothetical protein